MIVNNGDPRNMIAHAQEYQGCAILGPHTLTFHCKVSAAAQHKESDADSQEDDDQ